MILYFDSSGELIQMLPHVGTAENATAPRQQSALTINLYFDTNNSLVSGSNKVIWLRYKIPGQSAFSSDCPMTYAGEQEFESFENELVGKLEDGETYKVYSYSFTGNSAAVSLPGIVNFAFTIYNQTGTSPSYTYSDPIKLSNAKILIQETLGLEADSSIGMTPSEYQNLMAALNPVIGLKQTIDAGTGEFTFSKIIASQIFKGSSEISTLFAAKGGDAAIDFLARLLVATTVQASVLKIGNQDITNMFAYKAGTDTQDFSVKDLKYHDSNNVEYSLIAKMTEISELLDSLVNSDLNSWITSMNTLKSQFEDFMSGTSSDNIINTLSELRAELATKAAKTYVDSQDNTVSGSIDTKIATFLSSNDFKNKVKEIVDEMFADISEVEY